MKFCNVGIIIQARTGSDRFPKKVLASIEKKPMIWHIVNRCKKVKNIDKIILATTTLKEDYPLISLAKKNKIEYFRGSKNDVLDRFYQCSTSNNLDIIIRITGDCPLVDPKLIDQFLDFFSHKKYDYVSNTINPTYPDGLDIEIFSFKALKKAWNMSKKKSNREHVTTFIKHHPEKFKIKNFENNTNLSNYRLTVDHKNDLKLIRKIYKEFRPNIKFSTKSVISLLNKNPELFKINQNISRNEGYEKSLLNDN